MSRTANLSDDVVASRKFFLSNLTELFRLLLHGALFRGFCQDARRDRRVLLHSLAQKMRLNSDTPAFVGDTNSGYHGDHVK